MNYAYYCSLTKNKYVDILQKSRIIMCDRSSVPASDFVLVGTASLCALFHSEFESHEPISTIVLSKVPNSQELSNIANELHRLGKCVVLASETSIFELDQRLGEIEQQADVTAPIPFFDITSTLLKNYMFFQRKRRFVEPYVLILCVNPKDQVPLWLRKLEFWLNDNGFKVIYRHPLQNICLSEFFLAKAILMWNGTLSCFNYVKEMLNNSQIPFSYVECGFFPQTEYMYFDRKGINVESTLANDSLDWLPNDYSSLLETTRERLFNTAEHSVIEEGFVFVPLQLGHDSNIQLHSRFTSGMQEFIDYIEAQYSNERVVFKKHPRDTDSYNISSRNSSWSKEDSLSLIKASSKVHGINSTVLFEAALYGREIVVEGDCLLSRHEDQVDKIIAAILLRQCQISQLSLFEDRILTNCFLKLPTNSAKPHV